MGLFLLAHEKFCTIGENSPNGSYRKRVEEKSASIIRRFDGEYEIIAPGIIFNGADCEKAIRQFTEVNVDFVFAAYLSWAQDFAWNRFLRDMPPVPVLYVNPVDDNIHFADTFTDDGFAGFLLHAHLVGTLMSSGDSARYKRAMYAAVIGTWPEIIKKCRAFASAALIRSLLRHSSIGLMDNYNELMWSTYVDPYSVFMNFGPELHFLSLAELKDIINTVPESTVKDIICQLTKTYEISPGVDPEKFAASVRATIGLEKQAEQHHLDLLVLNDVDLTLLEQIGLRPGFYPLPGYGKARIVPEGDIGSGLGLYLLHLFTGKPVNYFEPFYVESERDTFIAGHAGPNDYTGRPDRTKIARDVRFEKSPYRYAGAPIAWHVFSEGIKTMVHCSQKDGHFKLVTSVVEVLPCDHFIATYCHGRIRPVGQTCVEFFRKLMDIGVTQHYMIAEGDCIEKISFLADMLGCEYYFV
jgi:L-arabinose isomerase